MTVYMDAMEKGGIKDLVRDHCEEVRETSDFGGDYAVGDYLIERKRWNEVPGRMMDQEKDLHWQLNSLVEAAQELGLTPVLLLEGEIGEAFTHTGVSRDRVSNYLDGASLLGVEQHVSTGRTATARKLARLEDGSPPDVRRIRGTVDDPMDEPRFVLEGVQGVGPGTAETILEHFGDVRSVAVASEDDLQEVKGIGPSTAGSIHEAFNAGWPP